MRVSDFRSSEIRAIRIQDLPELGNRLVLIYTPEFQEGTIHEKNTLRSIERLLNTMCVIFC
jgi:hypothetical protein